MIFVNFTVHTWYWWPKVSWRYADKSLWMWNAVWLKGQITIAGYEFANEYTKRFNQITSGQMSERNA